MPKNHRNRNTLGQRFPLNNPHVLRAQLTLGLACAADFHAPTVAGVLGVGPRAVTARLCRGPLAGVWLRQRNMYRVQERRASWSRAQWRYRLRAMGVEPVLLRPADPLFWACYRFQRGHLVRQIAADMRAERPGIHLAIAANLHELLERVVELATRPDLFLPI